MMTERIYTIMTTDVVSLQPTDSLERVEELIFEKKYHHLPVIDDSGKLVGIMTSWDLLKSGIHKKDFGKHKIEEVMSRKVATLHPNEMVGAAAMVFLRHLFHAIPIVEHDNTLVGIVTTHDVLVHQFIKENPNNKFIEETGWISKYRQIKQTQAPQPAAAAV